MSGLLSPARRLAHAERARLNVEEVERQKVASGHGPTSEAARIGDGWLKALDHWLREARWITIYEPKTTQPTRDKATIADAIHHLAMQVATHSSYPDAVCLHEEKAQQLDRELASRASACGEVIDGFITETFEGMRIIRRSDCPRDAIYVGQAADFEQEPTKETP